MYRMDTYRVGAIHESPEQISWLSKCDLSDEEEV